jgi:hypothetical protein
VYAPCVDSVRSGIQARVRRKDRDTPRAQLEEGRLQRVAQSERLEAAEDLAWMSVLGQVYNGWFPLPTGGWYAITTEQSAASASAHTAGVRLGVSACGSYREIKMA